MKIDNNNHYKFFISASEEKFNMYSCTLYSIDEINEIISYIIILYSVLWNIEPLQFMILWASAVDEILRMIYRSWF